MADVNEIEWPSFESVLRELSPERVEAREMRKLGAKQTPVDSAETNEEALVRDIPDSTVDDIAAVLMTEISSAVAENEAEAFVGEDPISGDDIDQLLGNEEFMGYLVDLDDLAPEDLTVSPEEAAQANFIPAPAPAPNAPEEPADADTPVEAVIEEPVIEYAPNLSVEVIDLDPTPEPPAEPEPIPFISLFNNADTKLYTESDPEWVWAQFAQRPPSDEVVDTPASEVDIDLVETAEQEVPDIDLVESSDLASAAPAAPPAPTEDPWADIRPSDDDEVADKKIVFWKDRPKFFGGEARHEARARRLYDND